MKIRSEAVTVTKLDPSWCSVEALSLDGITTGPMDVPTSLVGQLVSAHTGHLTSVVEQWTDEHGNGQAATFAADGTITDGTIVELYR